MPPRRFVNSVERISAECRSRSRVVSTNPFEGRSRRLPLLLFFATVGDAVSGRIERFIVPNPDIFFCVATLMKISN